MGNNWANGVDPDGEYVLYYDAINQHYTYKRFWMGGGNAIVLNIVGNDGVGLRSFTFSSDNYIRQRNIHITHASDGLVVSNRSLTKGLTKGYGSNTKYEYTTEDLVMRGKIIYGKSRELKIGLLKREEEGLAEPLTNSGAIERYGATTHKLRIFGIYLGNMLSLTNVTNGQVPDEIITEADATMLVGSFLRNLFNSNRNE